MKTNLRNDYFWNTVCTRIFLIAKDMLRTFFFSVSVIFLLLDVHNRLGKLWYSSELCCTWWGQWDYFHWLWRFRFIYKGWEIWFFTYTWLRKYWLVMGRNVRFCLLTTKILREIKFRICRSSKTTIWGSKLWFWYVFAIL